MKNRCTLALIILAGCSTRDYVTAPKSSEPPLPKAARVSPMPEAVTGFMLSYHRDYYLPIQYPPDATNYTWSLQESLDNSNWVTIQQFKGGPSNYNYDVHMNTNQVKFWRLKGVK